MSLLLLFRGSGAATPPTGTCPWTAVSNDAWITITSGSSGDGSGTVEYSVAENTDPNPRTGTITVAGYTHTVYQAGASNPDAGTGEVVTWQREPLRDTSNEVYARITYPNGYVPCVNIYSTIGRPQRDTWAYASLIGG